jgi:hypothetical protein
VRKPTKWYAETRKGGKSYIVEFNSQRYSLPAPANIPVLTRISIPIIVNLSEQFGVVLYRGFPYTWISTQFDLFNKWLEEKPYGFQLMLYKTLFEDVTLRVQPNLDASMWGKFRDHKHELTEFWWKEFCTHENLPEFRFGLDAMAKDRIVHKCEECGMKISMPKSKKITFMD